MYKMKFGFDLVFDGNFFQGYLLKLLESAQFVSKFNQVHAFLGVSGFNNVVSDTIYYQGQLKKRVGGHHTTNRCYRCLQRLFSTYRPRWFTVTSEGISYCKNIQDSMNGSMGNLFFDRTVRIRFGAKQTNEDFGNGSSS